MDFGIVPRTAVAWIMGVILSGCGHMPLTSMVTLAQINFETTDPAALRLAVKLPAAIRPQRDQVRLRLTVRLGGGAEATQDFVLKETSDPNDVAMLREEIETSEHVFAYRLDAAEAARLAAFRDDQKKKQAANGGRRGALTIAVVPETCRTGELAPGRPLFTTYLRTPETGRYVPLARDVDIQTLMPGRDLVSEMPPCGPKG